MKAVAVVARHATGGARERHLVAFFVGEAGGQQLREFLARRLPPYLVPAFFVPLESLPQMPNGKLDRRSLPELDSGRPALEAPRVAPRSQVEEILAGIWQEVLGFTEIGRLGES